MMAQTRLMHFFLLLGLSATTIIICFLIADNRSKLYESFKAPNISDIINKAYKWNASQPIERKDSVLILFWSTFFGAKLGCREGRLCNNAILKQCSTPCEITSNRSRVANSSIIIIHARDPYPLPPAKYSHIPLVLLTFENPVYTPVLSNPSYLSNFNYLMSYRADVADFFVSMFEVPGIEPKPIPFENKTGLLAAAFSNCEPGRTAYLKELMKYIQVVSYGACLRNKNGLQKRYHGDFKQAKTKLLRNFKFTIVFLNQDCDYFVDDQLTHALSAGTIPVYMGTDKVDELLGGNLKFSIIKVRDFDSPKKLADHLIMVSKNKTLYNSYLRWKYEGFQFPKSFLSSPPGSMDKSPSNRYCEMCTIIASSRQNAGKIKIKGSVKPDYCNARKVGDWLPKRSNNGG